MLNKFIRSLTLTLLFIFAIAFLWLSINVFCFLNTPINITNQPYYFLVKPGSTLMDVAWQLHRQYNLPRPRYFIRFAQLRHATRYIKAGEYLIQPGEKPAQFLKQLIKGQVILRSLTIVEGWTFAQMMNAVNSNPFLMHTLQGLDDKSIMTKMGYGNQTPEGHFFPNTYLFSAGTHDTDILQKAHLAMQKTLMTEWRTRMAGLPYLDSEQALTAASLVEKETAIPQERFAIAGVIVRRLEKNMYLQIDPTVIFGLGKNYSGKLTRQDLITDTSYNTYVHKGLPPTPIGMPSYISIHAALQPTPGSSLYFVAKGDGTHQFSDTLDEHNKAVGKYILEKNNLPQSSSSVCPIKPMPASHNESALGGVKWKLVANFKASLIS